MITVYDPIKNIPHLLLKKYPFNGTNSSVATSNASNPTPLDISVGENGSGYGLLDFWVMYIPETPTPRRMFNIGPPKQAEKPIMGANTC